MAILRTCAAIGVLFAAWSGASFSQDDPHKGLVLIQRTVDAKYDEDAGRFAKLLDSPLTQSYVVKSGDTLQGIVSQKFLIGPKATPTLYAGMASRIQALNDLTAPGDLKAGSKIALPDLPPVQWKVLNPDNPNYGVPRVQSGPSYNDVLKGNGLKAGFQEIQDVGRKAERLVNQWRWVTVDEAKAEAAANSSGGRIRFWSQPLTLKFAQVQAPSTAPTGTASLATDLSFLASLIKRRAPQQDVVLFVLDDSWPSDATFSSSRQFLVQAIQEVRKKYLLGDTSLDASLVNGTAKTDFPLQTPGRRSHAAMIDASLADFAKLSPRVKIVYVPLFAEQKWSPELWQELTYIALTASAMHSQLGNFPPAPDIPPQAKSDAQGLVAQIPKHAVDSLGPAQQTPISVLEKFAQLYAQSTGVPFFISMSWTVEAHEIDFGPDPNDLGVSLAATGNDGKDVIQDSVYLAYRAKAAPGDVLAVMNTDGSGAELCGSGKLPLSGPNVFHGLAYDGRVNFGGPQCGTSFSTPRVAWLLALRQAYNTPVAQKDWGDWYASFRTSVDALQSSPQTTSKRYWLPVSKLFNGL